MPHVRSAPACPVPGVSRSYDLVMAACEDGMDSSPSDDLAPDLDVEGEGSDAKNLSNVVVKPEPAGAGPGTGASASCDLVVASSEPVNDDEQGGDSTECSSSFGDSCCETDNEADHGHPEVNSPFSYHADGDRASTLPRKKKVTSEWGKAVLPMMWRCQWLELRIKDLSSQVSKYDKQLALIKQEKELQQAVTLTNGSRTELGQLCKGHENSSMDRRKRKRHEDTVDTSLYIKKHQILSYFYDKQNKGAETDDILVVDDSNDPVGDDIKGGLDATGLLEKSKEYDMVSEQLTLQKFLLTIDGIQSQVRRLQECLSKARSRQEKLAFADHAQVNVAEKRQRTKKHPFSYKNEYDRYTKPQKKKNLNILLKGEDRPAIGVISTLSERATDCLIEDAKENSEEKSGEKSQSHKKAITGDLLLDVDSSLPNGHMGDLCRENADDILIDNQAAKEGYQPLENVKHLLEKSPELAEKVETAAPSKVENTSAPVNVENTSAPAVKQQPVLEKPPALKPVYSGTKRGRKPKKKDRGSASASKNQSKGASKTPTAKRKTESTPPAVKKQKTESTPPDEKKQKTENARSKKQKTMNTPFPAKKGKTGNSAGKKQKAESSSSAARKEINENTPELRIEKAVLVEVNSRRSQRVRKMKIY